MKMRLPVLIGVILVLNMLCAIFPQKTSAIALTSVLLRLDRQAPNSSLSGLVCATPSTAGAGVEAQFSVTFPSDFTISTNINNWTTDTASLPLGATVWPSIGAVASSVSGTTVTFTSGDLTSATDTYCFTFTGLSSTTGSQGNKTGTMATRTSGNTIIDSSIYAVGINNDQVTVQAVVPAAPTDYITRIEAFPEDLPIREDLNIVYQITYESSLAYPTNITLEASWSLGTIEGSSIATVETLDYIVGSATKAYNSTPAVIDLTNRKITWTINQFPGESQKHQVTFRLRTSHRYTGKLPVTVTTSSRILGPGTATTPSTVTHTYYYNAKSSRPTATPGPTATGTPTPTPIPPIVAISGIRIRSLTATKAQIGVSLTAPGSISLRFGTSSREFSDRIVSPALQASHIITLDNLKPATQYFFRAQATSPEGKGSTSDIYTFTTAEESTPVQVKQHSLVLTSQKVVLHNGALWEEDTLPITVIPQDTPYEFQFSLQDKRLIKQIIARLEPYTVLGMTTSVFANEVLSEGRIDLLETANGVFTGKLSSPQIAGTYLLSAQVSDLSGNITEEPLVKLRVVQPFTITNQQKNEPVEHAAVLISHYNPKTHIYEKVTSLPFPNPLFSEASGTVPIILPLGTYEVRITHPLYTEKTLRFTLGIDEKDDYPHVLLGKEPFSLLAYLDYIKSSLSETLTHSISFMLFLFSSSRVVSVLYILSLLLLSILSILTLSTRLHVSILHLPSYIRNMLALLYRSNQYIQIQVVSQANIPVRYARVRTTHYEAYTDKKGICLLTIPHTPSLSISIKKRGYTMYKETLSLSERVHKLRITLTPDARYHPVLQAEKRMLTTGATGIVELWIVISFTLCFVLGLGETIILLLISILNTLLLFIRNFSEVQIKKSVEDYEAV